MTKENLWQVIIGMLVTAIFGVLLPMKWAAIFPAFLVAIIWAGIKQTSGKKYPNKDGEMVEPKFWKDFVPVIAGALVIYLVVVIL